MAEFKMLAWVLIGLAIFLWRMIQKARTLTTREQQQRPRNTGKVPPLPAGSFDELLKQFQTQNQAPGRPQNRPAAPPVPAATTPAGRPLPAETVPRARSLEQPEAPARSLEKPAAPHSLEGPRRPARRAASLPRPTSSAAAQEYWNRSVAPTSTSPPTVGELLRNPANVRTAFILGEILQRRF